MPKSVLYKNHFRTTNDVLSGSEDDSEGAFTEAPAWGRLPKVTVARAYLLFAGIVAFGYIITFAWRRSPWPLGDWLINYSGGFVRRGLPGFCIHLIAPQFHMSLVAGAASLQAACILCLVAGLWPLMSQIFRPGSALWERALLFSPATLAFFWLDPSLILRKEIGLFAVLCVLILLLRHRPAVSDPWVSIFLSLACPALLLSHEGLVCYMPYVAAVVALGLRDLMRAFKVCVVPGVLSVAAVAVASTHPGNQIISSKICASIGGPSELCQGPIGYIGISSSQYAGEVAGLFQDKRLVVVFLITGFLALLPTLAGLLDFWKKPVSRNTKAVLPATFILSAALSIVLFVQAQDWSRWIYIHIMCLMLMLFFAVDQRANDLRVSEKAVIVKRSRKWVFVATLAVIVYATTWRLPEWILLGARDYRPFGYSNLLQRVDRHSGALSGDLRR